VRSTGHAGWRASLAATDPALPSGAGLVDLVGWSYSSPIVMLVVLQHSELVHSLTLHESSSVTDVTDPAIAKIAAEDRVAALGPAIAAAKAGDFAGAARLTPIGVNHQPVQTVSWVAISCKSNQPAAENSRQ